MKRRQTVDLQPLLAQSRYHGVEAGRQQLADEMYLCFREPGARHDLLLLKVWLEGFHAASGATERVAKGLAALAAVEGILRLMDEERA